MADVSTRQFHSYINYIFKFNFSTCMCKHCVKHLPYTQIHNFSIITSKDSYRISWVSTTLRKVGTDRPIISHVCRHEEEPANWASECMSHCSQSQEACQCDGNSAKADEILLPFSTCFHPNRVRELGLWSCNRNTTLPHNVVSNLLREVPGVTFFHS